MPTRKAPRLSVNSSEKKKKKRLSLGTCAAFTMSGMRIMTTNNSNRGCCLRRDRKAEKHDEARAELGAAQQKTEKKRMSRIEKRAQRETEKKPQ